MNMLNDAHVKHVVCFHLLLIYFHIDFLYFIIVILLFFTAGQFATLFKILLYLILYYIMLYMIYMILYLFDPFSDYCLTFIFVVGFCKTFCNCVLKSAV